MDKSTPKHYSLQTRLFRIDDTSVYINLIVKMQAEIGGQPYCLRVRVWNQCMSYVYFLQL